MSKKRILCILIASIIAIVSCTSMSFAASKEMYYGKTPNGQKVYYKIYDLEPYQIKKFAAKPTEKQWKNYVKGAVDVGMCFCGWKITLPYATLCAFMGLENKNVSIEHGSRFFEQAQMHSIKERRFYIYTNNKKTSKRIVYIDQCGNADINSYIDPVGKNLEITLLKSKKDVKLKTKYYDNKNYILKRCGVNWNHKSKEVWRLNTEILCQTFK